MRSRIALKEYRGARANREIERSLANQAEQFEKRLLDSGSGPDDQIFLNLPAVLHSYGIGHLRSAAEHSEWRVFARVLSGLYRHFGMPRGTLLRRFARRLVVPHTLIEVWQCNAAGRYRHEGDQHPAPLDPHFLGVGRVITCPDGSYEFVTIKPGPYPWKNHQNAWRPAHVHFSLFGTEFTQRMVTQMYFPGDPLFPLDPIYQAITDQRARDRLVSVYDHDVSEHEWLLGYRWDIVLTGSHSTPMEPEEGEHA